MLIESLDDLDKPLDEYEIKSNPNLLRKEKEINLNIDSQGNVYFHSDHSTGIRWAVQHLIEGNAQLRYMYIEDDAIISIDISCNIQLLSFKSGKRKTQGVSNAFSMPLKAKKTDWNKVGSVEK